MRPDLPNYDILDKINNGITKQRCTKRKGYMDDNFLWSILMTDIL